MLKKKKVSNNPPTYRLFEHLPTLKPIFLGEVSQVGPDQRCTWWSRWGANRGEGPMEHCINKVIIAASKSDFIRGVKKRGMR